MQFDVHNSRTCRYKLYDTDSQLLTRFVAKFLYITKVFAFCVLKKLGSKYNYHIPWKHLVKIKRSFYLRYKRIRICKNNTHNRYIINLLLSFVSIAEYQNSTWKIIKLCGPRETDTLVNQYVCSSLRIVVSYSAIYGRNLSIVVDNNRVFRDLIYLVSNVSKNEILGSATSRAVSQQSTCESNEFVFWRANIYVYVYQMRVYGLFLS